MGRASLRTNHRAHKLGVSVSDTASDRMIAATKVIENSRNNRSTRPPINKIETNTATSERFIASKVKPTSCEPRIAARNGESPRSMWREIFSNTTMASSTTRPAATISAISDRLLSENPQRCITPNVPINDTGIARLGMSAARALPRNKNTTSITSPAEISSVRSDSRSVARMPGERSITTARSASAGNNARKPGNWALIASMVAIMLAPG